MQRRNYCPFLLLVIVSATKATSTSCPRYRYNALRSSAFEVAINLHIPTEQHLSCSHQDTQILNDLVKDSVEEATRRMDEWNPSEKLQDGESKVCENASQQSQRRNNKDAPITSGSRLLQHRYKLFRYYGAMRCSLCSKDNTDPVSFKGLEILKFDNISQSMKCHQYSPLRPTENIGDTSKEKSHYTVNVYAPPVAQELKIEIRLDLGNQPPWNGQHIYIIINGQTFDLGQFQNGPVVEKKSPGFNMTNEVGWSIRPDREYPSMHLVQMFIPRSFYSKTSTLKVEVLFGEKTASPRHVGRASLIQKLFGTILPASECDVSISNRKLERQTKNVFISMPTTPTPPISSPISAPLSSPVGVPTKRMTSMAKLKRASSPARRKKKTKSKRTRREQLGKKKISFSSREKKKRKKFTVSPIMNEKTDSGKTKEEESIVISIALPPVPQHSRSLNVGFQLQVKSTLSTVVEENVQNGLRPGHCMYAHAKSITAEVDVVPKPDWEQSLPSCDAVQEPGE